MTLAVQFQTLLAMMALGTAIGMNMDVYHRLLGRGERRIVFTRVCLDVLFWIIQALFVFYILLSVNEGELRFYIFIALAVGYYFYRLQVRSAFLEVLERLLMFIVRTGKFFWRLFIVLFVKPLKSVLKGIFTLCMIGLTAMTTVLFWLFNLLLFPLWWAFKPLYLAIARLFSPLFPETLKNSAKRLLKKWVRGWRTFFNRGDDE